MHRVATFGEMMLRLKAPGHERLFQSQGLKAIFGGAETNVAVSVSNYGMSATFVSALPANAVGDAAVAEFRRFGVDTRFIRRQGDGRYLLSGGRRESATNPRNI